MKVTVEVSDSEMDEICDLAGECKKGPAIRKILVDALTLRCREKLTGKFVSGKWGVEPTSFEAGEAAGRKSAQKRGQQWRK